MPTPYRLAELAGRLRGSVHGDPEREVRGIAPLDRAGPEHLSFLTHPRYRERARVSRAGVILVGPRSGLAGRDLLEVNEPYLALAELLELFHPPAPRAPGVSPAAHVAEDVQMGRDVAIGPFAVVESGTVLDDNATIGAGSVVGRECRVGRDTELKPRVVLYPRTHIGPRCIIHAGAVLGADGFGFATSGGKHRKMPQVGNVVVEGDVEIGANSAVDRAMLGETRIGEGSKIDDLVMVAHGAQVGDAALLAAQSGISGSTRIGARSTFAGQSGAAGHLEIGEGCVVAGKTAVFQDLPAGSFVAGVPAVHHLQWKRSQVLVRKLPALHREIRELRARLARLEQSLADRGSK